MGIVVVGAGVAGLGTALMLARDGHDVTLLDRDGFPEPGERIASPYSSRPGCPQINQGHAFLARARILLERHAPDVLDAMVAVGGNVTDGNLVLPPEHHDDELRTVAIRRPLIDEVLLDAVRKESRIRLEAATVAHLIEGNRNGVSSVAGAATADGRAFNADLVIDAAGRRSPMPAALEAIGVSTPPTRTAPCGFVAYGRYFETRPDAPLPPKFSPQVVRASLGYLQGGVYWQDARVIVVGLSPEADDRDLRMLRSETAFMAACRSIKVLSTFVDPSFAMPVSGVVSIGGLHNVRRRFAIDGTPVARGFAAIGDGLCHTNPTPAYGMSLALDQAVRLPDLVRTAGPDVAVALEEAVGDELDERYEHVSSSDAIRMAFAHGRPPDLERDREFLTEVGAQLVAAKDPGVLRRYLRRALALDRPGAMTSDGELMDEARAVIVERGLLERTPNPTRTDLLRAIAEAG